MNMTVEFCGIKMKSPIIAASGTFGYGIEYKDYMDMSEDMLRRSRILVICGSAVDETVLTDIAIANRFHVASSTMRGVLGVDKNKKDE